MANHEKRDQFLKEMARQDWMKFKESLKQQTQEIKDFNSFINKLEENKNVKS